jgi:hypothetical protein
VTDLSQFKIWTLEEFERVFPPLPSSNKPNGRGTGAQGAASSAGTGLDEIEETDLPDDLLEWIHDGVPAGEDRSVAFFKVVRALKKLGYGAEAVFDLFGRYPDGIAQKYLDRKESGSRARLRLEVKRAYDKPPKARAPKASAPAAPLRLPRLPLWPLAGQGRDLQAQVRRRASQRRRSRSRPRGRLRTRMGSFGSGWVPNTTFRFSTRWRVRRRLRGSAATRCG